MVESQIIEFFQNLDKNGSGRIGRNEFQCVCAKYIESETAATITDDIFRDLDCDQNGEVSLKDLLEYVRSDTVENLPTDIAPPSSRNLARQQKKGMIERRRSEAQIAWKQLVDGLGEPTLKKMMSTSGKKLEEVYHELQTHDSASPSLVLQFEGALSSLLQEVKQVLDDNENLKQMYNKEKEKHKQQLRGLEEELDAHVAQVEEEVQEKARRKFEQEKKEMMHEMDAQMDEIQNNLKISQKMNQFIIRSKEENNNPAVYESAFQNNDLYSTILDTKTNLAIVRSEMAKIKSDYETKCKELNDHQEIVMHYIDQSKHVQRQLALLQKANKNLQDTNDSLLSVIEKNGGRVSPYCQSRASSADTNSVSEAAQSVVSHPALVHNMMIENKERAMLSDHQLNETGAQYVIQRLMEDIDSGHSTLRDPVDWDHADRSSDGDGAFKSLESDDSKNSHPSLKRRLQCRSDYISSNTTSFETIGEPDRTYKIVFAGDACVGKSCFIHRFCKGTFASRLGSTLGVDFQIKTIRIDEKNIALQLWDTAGQERFRSMTKTYFRRADGVVLVYDVTSEKSFLSIREWIYSINEATDKKIPILICGNKVDLREDMKKAGVKCVERRAGLDLACNHEAIFYETSSKSGKNILDSLIALSREMSLREDVEVQTSALSVTTKNNSPENKSSCCSK